MPRRFSDLQPVLQYVAENFDGPVPLETLARRAGRSPFHLHRLFSAVAGETPKQLTLRLRLARAAVLLITSEESVLDIAVGCGFQSHETFCRAFRKHFRSSPSVYRKRGFLYDRAQARDHAAVVRKVAPCIGLYRIPQEGTPDPMTYSVTKKTLEPQPVLVVRKRVPRSAIAATIGQSLPLIFAYAQQHGIALAGLPFARYPESGHGMVTIEPGMRIASAASATGNSEVLAETLPGGPAAVTMHVGPYEKLQDAYAALQQWMEAEGASPNGSPWEAYVTDPSESPDPNEWKTEVFWPLAK